MDKIGKPRGLIRYTSELELEGRVTRRFRPRTIVYAGLILALMSALAVLLVMRPAYDINVGRSVGEPFTALPDGRISNRLRFRVRKQQSFATSFTIEALQPQGVEINVIGATPVALKPAEMKRVEAWVVIPADAFEGDRIEGVFNLAFDEGTTEQVRFTLLGPSP
jgi:polyferredoxin